MVIFIVLKFLYLQYLTAGVTGQNCWWTGCQPTTWGVRGCEQYGRHESERRNCEGGHEFNCCEKPPLTATTPAPVKEQSCWWTGCQPTSWGVRGCEQYGRHESERRNCEGGHEFNCCEKPPLTSTTPAPAKEETCWWTGCQPSSWGVRGCQQYERHEVEKRDCDGGHEFNCCPGLQPSPTKPTKEDGCWWSGCQPTSWAVRGCEQYDQQEENRRGCDGGHEFRCCPKEEDSSANMVEECFWSSCQVANGSSTSCPQNMRLKSTFPCDGESRMMECCGKMDPQSTRRKTSLLGGTYEDLVKSLFMEQDDFAVKPDKLRCDLIDQGKKHMVKIKNEAIRICDLCPKLPQKHLANVYLDRVASHTHENMPLPECFGLCYEDKKCMALSYDQDSKICYIFESTAGGFVEEPGWTTVLMTQPSGLVKDWTYTRHTRILGYLKKKLSLPSFLHCLDDCDKLDNCNFVSYEASNSECSLFSEESDVKFVDLTYGHFSAVRASYSIKSESLEDRFILEGEELGVKKTTPVEDKKCAHLRDATHGASFSQSCVVSGSAVLGCDQATGCKRCYYPERTNSYEKLSICPDSEFERLKAVKSAIQTNMKKCFGDKACVGVGYNSESEEISPMNIRSFINGGYNTKYMLKMPPKTDRTYLAHLDLIANAEIEALGGEQHREIPNQSYKDCINALTNSQFTVSSYSHENRHCRLSNERVKFRRETRGVKVVSFKRPSLLSPALNFLRIPGFRITTNGRSSSDCGNNCAEFCSRKCSKEHSEWCVYFSLKYQNNGAKCEFFDDDRDFSFVADELSTIFSMVSALDFTLPSFDKLDNFQALDIYDCFDNENEQSQTSLSMFDPKNNAELRSLRSKRGFLSFMKNLGNSVVDGFKKVGNAIADTAKGVVNTVGNVVKGDFKGAKESFLKIPVVDLAKNTGELAGAVFTGDWNKAKEKGKDIVNSDAFELVTTVVAPGAGKLITSGAKAIVKTATSAGKAGAKTIAKGGKTKVDDAARGGRNVKNSDRPKPKEKDKTPDKKKEDEKIDKDRGEKCDKRSKRATVAKPNSKSKPGNCNNNKKVKCSRPRSVPYSLGKTLDDCDNKDVGQKCRYECKPGYREKKVEATCVNRGGQGQWEPFPRCELVECSNADKQMIVYETPQSPVLGRSVLGDYIVAYVSYFDRKRRLPVWSVALHQSFQFESQNYNANQDFKRTGFTLYPCPELKNQQTKATDYAGRGGQWQKGHLTPFNPIRWSEKARKITFVYTNAAPQDSFTNQGLWGGIEAHVYCFSKRYRSIVATGICPDSLSDTIGSGIKVPKCFWKMACYRDENSNTQVVGFYASNSKPLSDKDKENRGIELQTPLSQKELSAKVGMGFTDVWVKPAKHINTGRPVPIGSNADAITGNIGNKNDGVWMPVNSLSCNQAQDLSKDEKDGWDAAIKKGKSSLKRGEGVGKPDFDNVNDHLNSGSGNKGKKKKTRRAATLDRGCREGEMKNALDAVGFFLPTDDYSKPENDDGNDEKDEGDGSVKVGVQSCGKRIIGYYTSWGKKTIGGRELQRLTHVIYAFLELHSDGHISVGSADRKNAEDVEKETRKAKERLEDLMSSAQRYPHLKVMFAVGGWENSQYFSAIAASPGMRVKFIASIIQMIEEYGFDGVDIDWEYPVTGGADEGVPADKENYVVLMKEVRTALDGVANRVGRKDKFLLSFAGAAGQWTLDPGYDMPGLLKYADFANIMTYDYFGAWASKWGAYTGPPSPLYFGMPPGFSGKTNADWSVKYYTCKSKLPHKINMGVPFYGRYWKNVGDSVDGKDEMWRKASAVNGKFEGGYVPWYEVKEKYLNNGAFQKKYHEKAQAPYAWNPSEKIFLGYEDQKSLQEKVKYAIDKNVGGLMIWALELDDDDLTLLDTISKANLCQKTDPKDINHKCSPIDDKRWWTPEDGEDKAGLCGRSAPLYKGFYPVCDPDDPGYSCCGVAGYCGSGPKYCDCPTCKNYREDPKTILTEPIKPSIPVTWYLLNDPDGKRGRCGRKVPKINGVYPTCNPDDENSFCCSNGGYCGNTDAHCKCNGCVDFKKNKNYKFGPKKWWTLEDGKDLGGQCGPKAPKVDGIYEAECEGSSNFHCCTPSGWCGSGPDFCGCKGCKDFRGKN